MTDYEIDIDKALNRTRGFKHPPINVNTQVRLLRIAYRDDSLGPGPANCSLEVFDVTDLPRTRYKALSYMWGTARTEDDIRDVDVGGQPFAVRRNLDAFLATVATRKRRAEGLFFIDAVCINQLNLAEREAQVRLMARIFRCANEVVTWLGKPSKGTGQEYANVRALALATKPQNRSQISPRTRTGRLDYGEKGGLGWSPCHSKKSWTATEWAGLHHLTHHPYWRRIWVVQEIQLAKRGVVWCGPFKFPLSLLATSASTNTPHQRTTRLNADGSLYTVREACARAQSPAAVIITHRLRQVQRPAPSSRDVVGLGTLAEMTEQLVVSTPSSSPTIETYHSHVPDLLHHIIPLFGGLDCTDPRDRLYGLLGLLHERSAGLVAPDYSRGIDHAVYQALRAGIVEIAREMRPVIGSIDDVALGGIIGFGAASGDSSAMYSDSGYPLYHEQERIVIGTCLAYYCDVRDAFGIPDERCADIFGRVLRELKGWGWNRRSDRDLDLKLWNDDDSAFVRSIPQQLRRAGWRFGDGGVGMVGEDIVEESTEEPWSLKLRSSQRDVTERM